MSVLLVDDLQGPGFGPVSLRLEAGECLGLMGPSGAGKSRLLRALADLDPATGRVVFDGQERDTWDGPMWRRQVGYIPADSRWWLNPIRGHFLQPDALPLAELGLTEALLDSPADRLSSGERQRLALLRQLQCQPRILLLDEPTANLDASSRDQYEGLVGRLRRQQGLAVIWVSHDPAQLDRVSSGRLCIAAGQLRACP